MTTANYPSAPSPTVPATLHLLHMRPDLPRLTHWAARHQQRMPHRMQQRTLDLGDVLHGVLRAAFGDQAPQPFRYLDEHQGLLAYTRLDAQTLAAHIQRIEDQTLLHTLGLHTDAAGQPGWRLRPFPTDWRQGQVLGFNVRLRPTVRTARGEQDAFLHARARAERGTPLQREAIYTQWLRDHLTHRDPCQPPQPWQNAVELLDARLLACAHHPIVRRTQPGADGQARETRTIAGPDITLTGRLRISHPEAFAHLLARGVGRHRAFGFGMLLLHSTSG